MLRIGEYQTLTIVREMPQGFYLEDDEGNEVLFPQKYITDDMAIDDKLNVFVYCDSNDREVATTEKPFFTVDQFALLEVVASNEAGVFCDWGIMKQLFIPISNQYKRINVGEKHVVYMYLDEVTDRLVGTTRIDGYLDHEAPEGLEMGMEVNCVVYRETDLGYKVIMEEDYGALIYKNETPSGLKPGQKIVAYVKPLRPDGKIDLSINAIGVVSIDNNAQKIMTKLERNDNYLPFTDKSDPEAIRNEFGISKKLFKKAIGQLYKQKLVKLEADGIYKV